MTKKHYVLKCTRCGAPAADCVRICPYCGQATGFDDLGLGEGVRRGKDGGMIIENDARVVIGHPDTEPRPCPFCGAEVEPAQSYCKYCKEKVVIETLRIATLVISGGSMVIGGGGSVQVIGRRVVPAHKAAQRGDVAELKAAINDGDDPDHQDGKGRTPLHYAASRGQTDALRYLLSIGADANATDDRDRTPLAEARAGEFEEVVQVLSSVGAK
jgi:hypothetical protein